MSQDEKEIMARSVRTALTFGLSWRKVAKDNIEDNGYKWTDVHDQYLFDHFVEASQI